MVIGMTATGKVHRRSRFVPKETLSEVSYVIPLDLRDAIKAAAHESGLSTSLWLERCFGDLRGENGALPRYNEEPAQKEVGVNAA